MSRQSHYRRHLVHRIGWMHALAGAFFRKVPGQITCREFEAFLIDYCEGALSDEQISLFERHMRLCTLCRTSFDAYTRVIRLGHRLCENDVQAVPEDVPQELIDAVLAARAAG